MAYQIFETADGQRTALYAQGNSVFSCQLPFMRGMTPKELRADYLAHLDAMLFRDTVCFVYENLEHQVVIDSLGGSPARILLADIPDGYRFEGLQLIERENGLYLFYQICGRGEKAGLYVCMPYRENVWGTVLEGQEGSWRAEAVQTEEGERLLCLDRRTGRLRIYDWNKEADFTERPVLEEAEHRRQMEALEAAWREEKAGWQREKRAWQEEQASWQEKLTAWQEEQASWQEKLTAWQEEQASWQEEQTAWQREKAAWQQEKEERMIQCRKEYHTRVERLRAEYEGKLSRCREGYELQLGQAKHQYDELARTAVKLQQIGRKWRDKYFGRIEEKA